MMTNVLNNLKNKKGLTMIELMLAILIAGIITAAIGGYLAVHIRSYETAQDLVDVQYEAQMALNGMSEIIMESRGLYEIESQAGTFFTDGDLGTTGINTDGYVEDVRALVFTGLEEGGFSVYHVFVKEADSTELMYYNTTDAAIFNDLDRATMFARNIKSMEVVAAQPSHSDTINSSMMTFEEAEAVEIIFILERGESRDLEVRTIAKYRNVIPE